MMSAQSQGLVLEGETLERTLRFSRDEMAAFAVMSYDDNPLHRDRIAAQRAGFADIIAAGQHSAALLMGMLATHYSRDDDGIKREMLCLNMNFSFKHPVLAEQEISLRWRVASVIWKTRLNGMLTHLDGSVCAKDSAPSVIARGTILVKKIAE